MILVFRVGGAWSCNIVDTESHDFGGSRAGVSYVRVSNVDQNRARQREMIGLVDREFGDEISTRSRDNHPRLDECIDYLRHGDTLQGASIDRFARFLVNLRGIIDQITTKGVSVYFVQEHLTFPAESTAPGPPHARGADSFAESERSIIRERQAEDITLAKKAGKYKGRKRALTSEQLAEARRWAATESSRSPSPKTSAPAERPSAERCLNRQNTDPIFDTRRIL